MFLCRFEYLTPCSKLVFSKKKGCKTRCFVKIKENESGDNAMDIKTLKIFHIQPDVICWLVGELDVSIKPI
jgi:hypothetical protein